ncbi:MAG: hypothetical protein LBD23_05195, partial [Oscillospiraceae bacterium]|nr:hypothetical protein [Oscillospiraceae bacterium]
MKVQLKKQIALVLALVMILSMLPIGVAVADNEFAITYPNDGDEIEVGESFKLEFANADGGQISYCEEKLAEYEDIIKYDEDTEKFEVVGFGSFTIIAFLNVDDKRVGDAEINLRAIIGIGKTSGNNDDITDKFICPKFQQAILDIIDDGDEILKDDVEVITNLNLSELDITDLAGIEYFTALEHLDVSKNQLVSIDVSENTNLEYLDVSDNELNEINGLNSLKTSLKHLDIQNTHKGEGEVGERVGVKIGENSLNSLDISDFVELTALNVEFIGLKELIVKNNPKLETLNANGNELKEIEVNSNTALKNLAVAHNFIEKIDLTGLNLNFLYVLDNLMSSVDDIINLNAQAAIGNKDDFGFHPQKESSFNLDIKGGTASSNTLAAGDSAHDVWNNRDIGYFFSKGDTVTVTTDIQDFVRWTAIPANFVDFDNATEKNATFTTLPGDYNEVTIIAISAGDTIDILDDNFRDAVKEKLGLSPSDKIYKAEVEGITELNLQGREISNLEGIQHFTALKNLYVSDNKLTSLDFTDNKKLENLGAENNRLQSINISGNEELVGLDLTNNQLKSLDVTYNIKLSHLQVCNTEAHGENSFSTIDLTGNPNLTALQITNVGLNTLDLSNKPHFTHLHAGNNNLTTASIATITSEKLEVLDVPDNNLTSINVSMYPVLWYLNLERNQIVSDLLDFTPNTKLRYLLISNAFDYEKSIVIGENQIKRVILLANTELKLLIASHIGLEKIDVSNNTGLEFINIERNNIIEEKLDFTLNINLEHLQIGNHYNFDNSVKTGNNQIIEIILPANSKLKTLAANHIGLEKIDVSKNTGLESINLERNNIITETFDFTLHNKLEYLLLGNHYDHEADIKLGNSKIKNIILSGTEANEKLKFVEVRNIGLDTLTVGNAPNLRELYASTNNLGAINVKNSTKLKSLDVGDNNIETLDISG